MRLIADENVPKKTVDELRDRFHDVLWIRTHAPGLNDKSVLVLARQERRVILTLDKDFRQLALQQPSASDDYGVIVFHIHPALPEIVTRRVLSVLSLNMNWFGHLSVVDSSSIRMVRFPALNR